MANKRVLSGIRATGRLHIGNYFGAVKGMIELQDSPEYETFYMVADVHTITTPYSVEELKKNRREVVLDYLAAGLDPQKSTIFMQSDVPEHLELAFYFSSVVTIARMQHLPTYKDKVKQFPKDNSMALLNYPVLMAADILAYKANMVPVGIDQEPHLEVAREVARKMNDKYGTDFPEPQRFEVKIDYRYIPSLTGKGKMSKTVEGSYILLTDDLKTIRNKVAKIPTDSGKGSVFPEAQPKSKEDYDKYEEKQTTESMGVAVLVSLVELFQGKDREAELKKQYITTGLLYKEIKDQLAEAIYTTLKPLQERRAKISQADVDRVIKEGATKARETAHQTVLQVKKAMGLA